MTSEQPKKAKKFPEFLLRLRGPSFLLLAGFFLLLIVADIFSMFSLWDVAFSLLTLAALSIPLDLLAFLIGGWGIFETLRRSGSRRGIFALVGLGILLLPILIYLISLPFSRSNPPGQTNTDTAALYVFLFLVIICAWASESLIGLAVLVSKQFTPLMRLGGMLLIVSIPAEYLMGLLWDMVYQLNLKVPLETIFGETGHWLFHHWNGFVSAFKLLSLAGCLLIGIGFLRPPFRRPTGLTAGKAPSGTGEAS